MPDRFPLEGLFRHIVEVAPSAMVLINVTGRMELVNAQAEYLFGYTRDEMLGQPIEMLVPERFRARHSGLRSGFFTSPRHGPMAPGRDLYALRKDNSEFPVEIGLNPIETEDGPMVLSAIVDLTHRREEAERLQASLREKETLLGEIHHRVKNNLQIIYSLLNLQSARVSDPTARDLLRDSQNRIRSMALVHQTLYGSRNFAKVDFARFIDTLLPVLTEAYGVDANRVIVRIDVEPVRLPIDTAVPCGLLVNELLTNAFKHAFGPDDRGEIRVALTRQLGHEALLSVSDNGVGLPKDFDTVAKDTLGLQLVAVLADQLDGVISIRRADPTLFALRFPI